MDFVLPRYCPICSTRLLLKEKGICPSCLFSLPRYKADFHKGWDRVQGTIYPIEAFWGGFLFQKKSKVQSLIHEVKYHRNREAAIVVGEYLARELKISSADFDMIVPIPISWQRKIKRGYNQTFFFAEGISRESGIPIHNSLLIKVKNPHSQTNKRREERLAMQDIFSLGSNIPKGMRILLLDDVLTTGTTIVSGADTLAKLEPSKLVLMTISVDIQS